MKKESFPEGPFTIQALSRASGVTVASIKFYVREGLLPAGDTSRPGRAYYDARHLRRLALVRALRDVAGLSIDTIRRALVAVDAPRTDAVDAIAPAIDALAPSPDTEPVDDHLLRARADVAALFKKEKLVVRPEAGSRESLARTMAAIRRIGAPLPVEDVLPYVASMRALAELEVTREETQQTLLSDKEGSLEIAVLGTVLFEPLMVALRRAMHEHFTTSLVRKTARKRARR